MPFFGIPRFVVSAKKAEFWQQLFRGVGRLRLSCKGVREPRLGKCNDSRLFVSFQNLAKFFVVQEGTPEV